MGFLNCYINFTLFSGIKDIEKESSMKYLGPLKKQEEVK
jgi:hypothetical protein